MATFITPSTTAWTHRGIWGHTRRMSPVRAVGNRMNRPTEKAIPRAAAMVMKMEAAFSWVKWASSHFSSQPGSSSSSCSSPSSDTSAECIRAWTPWTMAEPKTNTPRTRGSLANQLRGCIFLVVMSSSPLGLRTTMARFSGPCIIMPSMRA